MSQINLYIITQRVKETRVHTASKRSHATSVTGIFTILIGPLASAGLLHRRTAQLCFRFTARCGGAVGGISVRNGIADSRVILLIHQVLEVVACAEAAGVERETNQGRKLIAVKPLRIRQAADALLELLQVLHQQAFGVTLTDGLLHGFTGAWRGGAVVSVANRVYADLILVYITTEAFEIFKHCNSCCVDDGVAAGGV